MWPHSRRKIRCPELSGGSPREGVRSEARAEQRLAAGGAAPPTRIAYFQKPSLNRLEFVDDQPPGLPRRIGGDVWVGGAGPTFPVRLVERDDVELLGEHD